MAEISHGQVNLNTVLGAIGTAGAVMPGVLGNLFGGAAGGCNNACSDNQYVTRYDAQKDARIAELETQVQLRDANTFTMGEMSKLRDYVDGKFAKVDAALCQQAVHNATNDALVGCLQGQVAALQSLTKVIVPSDNICPPPMPLYNSWTAPTTTTTTGT